MADVLTSFAVDAASGVDATRFVVDASTIAESIPHIVWTAQPDGKTTYFNRRGTEYTGRKRETTYEWGWLDLIHPDDVDRARRRWEAAVADEEEFVLEYRLRRFDGLFLWHSFRALPLRDGDGEVALWIGTATDIDDRKRLELRSSELLTVLDSLQAAAPIGLGLVDREFRYRRVNDRLAEMNGVPAAAHVGRCVREVVPQLWPTIEPVYQRVLERNESALDVEITGTAAEAAGPRTFLVSCYPVAVQHEVVGIGLVVADITERRRAEEAAAFRARLLDAAGDAIVATTAEATVVYANAAAEHLYGWQPGEMLGRSGLELFAPPGTGGEAAAFLADLQAGMDWSGEFVVKRRDDTTLPVLTTVRHLRDDNGALTGLVGVSRDITERTRAEDALRNNLDALIDTIANTVEYRDPYTAGHQRRVGHLAAAIAMELGLPSDVVEGIERAARIHDLGKIAVPSDLLTKPSTLTTAEYDVIKQHAEAGYQIVAPVQFPWPIADMIRQHHERLDGSGYPHGIASDAIGLGARILAVADTVEAMSAHRPYRPSRGVDRALAQIRADRGTRLDADVVDACCALFDSGRFTVDPATGVVPTATSTTRRDPPIRAASAEES